MWDKEAMLITYLYYMEDPIHTQTDHLCLYLSSELKSQNFISEKKYVCKIYKIHGIIQGIYLAIRISLSII